MKKNILMRFRRSLLPASRCAIAPAAFALPMAVQQGPVARAFRAARSGDRRLLPSLLMTGMVADGHGTSGSRGGTGSEATAPVGIRLTGGVRGVPPRGRSA